MSLHGGYTGGPHSFPRHRALGLHKPDPPFGRTSRAPGRHEFARHGELKVPIVTAVVVSPRSPRARSPGALWRWQGPCAARTPSSCGPCGPRLQGGKRRGRHKHHHPRCKFFEQVDRARPSNPRRPAGWNTSQPRQLRSFPHTPPLGATQARGVRTGGPHRLSSAFFSADPPHLRLSGVRRHRAAGRPPSDMSRLAVRVLVAAARPARARLHRLMRGMCALKGSEVVYHLKTRLPDTRPTTPPPKSAKRVETRLVRPSSPNCGKFCASCRQRDGRFSPPRRWRSRPPCQGGSAGRNSVGLPLSLKGHRGRRAVSKGLLATPAAATGEKLEGAGLRTGGCCHRASDQVHVRGEMQCRGQPAQHR